MKQTLKVGLTLSILLLSLSFTSNGQNTVTGMEVFLKPVSSVGVKDSSNSGTTPYNVVYAINLSGVTGIANIHVKLGATVGGSEKAAFVIPFDAPPGNVPAGASYKRKNNTVYIGLGVHTDMQNYHAEVSLEDSSGTISPAVKPIQ